VLALEIPLLMREPPLSPELERPLADVPLPSAPLKAPNRRLTSLPLKSTSAPLLSRIPFAGLAWLRKLSEEANPPLPDLTCASLRAANPLAPETPVPKPAWLMSMANLAPFFEPMVR
jgi:hypothetical protein